MADLQRARGLAAWCLPAAVMVVVAGCSYRQPYPANWPPLPVPTSADCRYPPLRIEDAGVHGRTGRRISFVAALFGSGDGANHAGSVVLAREGAAIRVTYVEPTDSGNAPRPVRDVTDAGCESGWLVLHDTHVVAGAGAAALSAVTFRLAVAPGYVMVEQVERAAGIALVVPVVAEASDWMWFRRID